MIYKQVTVTPRKPYDIASDLIHFNNSDREARISMLLHSKDTVRGWLRSYDEDRFGVREYLKKKYLARVV